MQRLLPAIVAIVAAALAAPAGAQVNRCAQCHYANLSDVPAPTQLGDWEQSAHARHGVTCDRCHGGDPTTFVPFDAHRGMLASRDHASPVNRANLPTTCGGCHSAPVSAFAKSWHVALLESGDARAPSCSTCHGAMTARRPSPALLERACADCHRADTPSAGYPASARTAVEAIAAIRVVLMQADQGIAKIANPIERQRLTAEQRLIERSLTTAIDALHAFDLNAVDVQLRSARERAEAFQREVRATGG